MLDLILLIKKMKYLKKHWSSILFGFFIILMIIPETRIPVQVFLQRTISLSPSEIKKENRTVLKEYDWKLSDLHSNNVNLSVSKDKVILIIFGQHGVHLVLLKYQLFKISTISIKIKLIFTLLQMINLKKLSYF